MIQKILTLFQIENWIHFFAAFKRYIYAGRISILICLSVIVLLTLSFQSIEIIIDFMESPLNILVFWPLFIVFAIVISHYPAYLDIKNKKDFGKGRDDIKWFIDWPFWLRKFMPKDKKPLMGIISYRDENKVKFTNETPVEIKFELEQAKKIEGKRYAMFRNIRHWFGTIFLTSFIYIILVAYSRLITEIPALGISGGLILLLTIITVSMNEKRIKAYITLHSFLSFLSVILFILTLTFSSVKGWHPITFWTFLSLNVISAINFILFRFLRSNARNELKDLKDWGPFNVFLRPARLFQDHVKFLDLMHTGGILSILIIIYSTIKPYDVSPVVIILSFLYTFYGLIINPMKHRFYYEFLILKKKDETKKHILKGGKIFVRYLPILPLLFVIYTFVCDSRGAQLHALDYIAEDTANVIHEDSFRSIYARSLEANKHDSNIYFIACYGGGLTANVWSNYVLDTLSHYGKSKISILQNTISISGVSGGGMGQGIYAAIVKNSKHPSDVVKTQDKLDDTRFISLDISWLLGWDLIREYFSFGRTKKDRAKRSLDTYADIVQDPNMLHKTYRSYWGEMVKEKYFPMLITNTSGKNNVNGVAATVDFKEFENVFPGSIDILKGPIQDENRNMTSLPYLQTLSTTNRFPVISPQAKISAHGYFADAGYLENSGLLSQYKLYQYLKKDSSWNKIFKNRKVVFIQIMNGTASYLNDRIQERQKHINKVKDVSELMAIVQTKVELNSLPFLANKLVKNIDTANVSYVPIALPFPINENDVKAFLGAEDITQSAKTLFVSYNDSIAEIRNAQGSPWNTSYPSTSRLVVRQSSFYMKKCLENGLPLHELNARLQKSRKNLVANDSLNSY